MSFQMDPHDSGTSTVEIIQQWLDKENPQDSLTIGDDAEADRLLRLAELIRAHADSIVSPPLQKFWDCGMLCFNCGELWKAATYLTAYWSAIPEDVISVPALKMALEALIESFHLMGRSMAMLPRKALAIRVACDLRDQELCAFLLQDAELSPELLHDQLFKAVSLGQFDLACFFMHHLGDRLDFFRDGDSLLIVAIEGNHESLVKLLIERGADVNAYGTNKHYFNLELPPGLEQDPFILRDVSPEKTSLSQLGKRTPIQAASRRKMGEIVRILLDAGARTDEPDADVIDAIQWAVRDTPNDDIVMMLLDHGATTRLTLEEILNSAVVYGQWNFVSYLLNRGADPTKLNRNGTSFISEAALRGYHDVVKLLLDHGASLDGKLGTKPLEYATIRQDLDMIKILLDAGANPNLENHNGETPLMCTSQRGFINSAKLLLAWGVHPVTANDRGVTPILMATEEGHTDMAKWLLDNGANIDASTVEGLTPLMSASRSGHIETVQLLLNRGADSKATDERGLTAALYASIKAHTKVLKLLLDEGVNLKSEENHYQRCKLLCIEAAAGSTGPVGMLLDKGADINVVDDEKRTPLSNAAFKGHTEVVKLLVERGADLKKKDRDQKNPLFLASQEGHTDAVIFLLDHGAKTGDRGRTGLTPLMVASSRGNTETVKVLLERGADINARDDSNDNALQQATSRSNTDIMTILLNKGAEPTSALWTAFRRRRYKIVKLLLDRGADPNFKDTDGTTPLLHATSRGRPEVVQLLLAKGADPNATGENGSTALMFALYAPRHSFRMTKLLLENGADPDIAMSDGDTFVEMAEMEDRDDVIALLELRKVNSEAKSLDGTDTFTYAEQVAEDEEEDDDGYESWGESVCTPISAPVTICRLPPPPPPRSWDCEDPPAYYSHPANEVPKEVLHRYLADKAAEEDA